MNITAIICSFVAVVCVIDAVIVTVVMMMTMMVMMKMKMMMDPRGSGWMFENKPGAGVLCVRQAVEEVGGCFSGIQGFFKSGAGSYPSVAGGFRPVDL